MKLVLSFLFLSMLKLAENTKPNKLLFVMLDGFRYDYVQREPPEALPGFNRFLNEGGRAVLMRPAFPSKSCPCWTTLATGLYTESHGIVMNAMYDSKEKTFFNEAYQNSSMKKWWTVEPIWITATKNGLTTASVLFSKCDVVFDNVTIKYCEPHHAYFGMDKVRESVDTAMSKLKDGYDFVLLFIPEVDTTGHYFGPNSDKMHETIREIDGQIQKILEKEKEYNLTGQVNMIIVGDHGMRDLTSRNINTVEIDDYLLIDDVEVIIGEEALVNIKVLPDRSVDKVYSKLKEMPGVHVYKHKDIPDELHYRDSPFIHDIIVKAPAETFIMPSRSKKKFPLRPEGYKLPLAVHNWWAYDDDEVNAIFFARGPDIKSGHTIIPAIEQVDVYPLLAHLLKIQPRNNNGSLDRIKGILKEDIRQEGSKLLFLALFILAASFAFLLYYVFCKKDVKLQKNLQKKPYESL